MPSNEATNIAIVRRFIDGAVNGRDPSVIDETWSDDLIWHGGSLGTFKGKAAFKKAFSANATSAWSDMHLEIHEIIATADKVVLRFTNSGTNIGPFMGNPPTGKHAEWLGTASTPSATDTSPKDGSPKTSSPSSRSSTCSPPPANGHQATTRPVRFLVTAGLPVPEPTDDARSAAHQAYPATPGHQLAWPLHRSRGQFGRERSRRSVVATIQAPLTPPAPLQVSYPRSRASLVLATSATTNDRRAASHARIAPSLPRFRWGRSRVSL
jgi:predicted ester cyclase